MDVVDVITRAIERLENENKQLKYRTLKEIEEKEGYLEKLKEKSREADALRQELMVMKGEKRSAFSTTVIASCYLHVRLENITKLKERKQDFIILEEN